MKKQHFEDRLTYLAKSGRQKGPVWFTIALVGGAFSAGAVGFRLPNQDPEAIARGNAFVATADNPSAIYYNPAGITQLSGQNVRAGVYAVNGGIDYESPAGKASIKSEVNFAPEFYYVYSPENLPLSFGLGVYAPFGLSLDWGTTAPFRTVAEKGSLSYITVNPVVAWKITSTLSVSAGPTFSYSEAEFEQALPQIPPLVPEGRFKLKGTGWEPGLTAGIRWQPHDKWAFGLSYHYSHGIDYDGTSQALWAPVTAAPMSSSATIPFPQYVVAGVSFRPTENWNLEFDLDWTDWDSVKQIPIQHTALGNTAILLNYKSSFMYEFGVTRQLGKGYFASIGYFFSENSSPDQTFTPLIPDSDLHLGSVGFGHHGLHWDWAIAYHFGYNPGRDVTSDVAHPIANGTYHILNQAINLALTYKL